MTIQNLIKLISSNLSLETIATILKVFLDDAGDALVDAILEYIKRARDPQDALTADEAAMAIQGECAKSGVEIV